MGLFDRLQDMPNLEEGIKKVQETPGAVLLDVRSVEEYRQGHLEGSVNLPINQIPTIDISKDTPIFVYCLSGARSKRAEKFLQKNGYQAENIGGLAGYKGKLVVQIRPEIGRLRLGMVIHAFAVNDAGEGADGGCDDCGANDCGRIDTSILAAVGNDVDWNQLQGRDIENQEGAHFIAGNALFLRRQSAVTAFLF